MCWVGMVGTQSWMAVWPFVKVAMLAALVTLVICAIRRLRRERHSASPMTPLEILKARYARGELSRPDFESMRHDIGG
jgi:putative membrane protein